MLLVLQQKLEQLFLFQQLFVLLTFLFQRLFVLLAFLFLFQQLFVLLVSLFQRRGEQRDRVAEAGRGQQHVSDSGGIPYGQRRGHLLYGGRSDRHRDGIQRRVRPAGPEAGGCMVRMERDESEFAVWFRDGSE